MGSPAKDAIKVFVLALAARLALTAVFFTVYGVHATHHVELWLYLGVAEGTHETAVAVDPTSWMLAPLGSLLDADVLFYAIAFLGSALSSLTAALICVFAARTYDEKTGLYCGLLYAFMVEPLTLSIVGFTHDLLAIPLGVAGLLAATYAFRGSSIYRITALAFSAALLWMGSLISAGGYVAVAATFIYLAVKKLSEYERVLPVFLALSAVGLIVGAACVIPTYLDSKLSSLPQGRSGSADVQRVRAHDILFRYNALLLLIPFGLVAAHRRREYVGVFYVFIGAALAYEMSRGTRVLDVGAALVGGYALTHWRSRWDDLLKYLLPPVLGLTLFYRMDTTYKAGIVASSLLLTYLILKKKTLQALSVIALSALLLTGLGMHYSNEKVVSDAEYRIYQSLEGSTGKVLTSWGSGYMAETITGLDSVSNAGIIQYPVHQLLWLPQEMACTQLKKAGVEYVVFSSDNFRLAQVGSGTHYLLQGGLLFEPDDLPAAAYAKYLTAYVLNYGGFNESLFELVAAEEDPVLDKTFRAYRLGCRKENTSSVSFIALNHGPGPANTVLNVTYSSTAKPPKDRTGKPVSPSLNSYALCSLKSLLIILSVSASAYLLFAFKKTQRKVYVLVAFMLLAFAFAASTYDPLCYDMDRKQSDNASTSTNADSMVFEVEFEDAGEYEVTLYLGDVGHVQNCDIEVLSPNSGYVGASAFTSVCDKVNESAKILLVDETASKHTGHLVVEDEFEVWLSLSEGETRRIRYSFNRGHPHREYEIGYWKSRCVKTVAEESMDAVPVGVEIGQLFCSQPGYRR